MPFSWTEWSDACFNEKVALVRRGWAERLKWHRTEVYVVRVANPSCAEVVENDVDRRRRRCPPCLRIQRGLVDEKCAARCICNHVLIGHEDGNSPLVVYAKIEEK